MRQGEHTNAPPPPSPRARWSEAAIASAVPLAALIGGALASWVADARGLHGVDHRLAHVGFGLVLPLLGAYLRRPDARARALIGIAGLPLLVAPFFPRSPLIAFWLAGGVLLLGLLAVIHAGRSAWRLGASTPSRAGLALIAAGPGAYLWAAAAVVLVNTVIVVAPVRLAHQRPSVARDERTITLHTVDGYAIEGTYTRGADGAGAVLLVHGVADGRDRWLPWVERLRAMGLHALRIDVRAHGRSDGGVVTYGQRETADVDAALGWLRAEPGVDRHALAMVGTSMGGGIVLAASRGAPVRAAIALAPASSYPTLVAQRTALLGPLAPFVMNGSRHLAGALGQTPMTEWVPAAHMSRTLPVLVAHGTEDRTIPLALSRRLAARRANVELHPVRAGHDDIPAATATDTEWPRFAAFLSAHGVAAHGP